MLCILGITSYASDESNITPSLNIEINTLELKNAVFMNFKVATANINDQSSVKLLVWDSYPGEYDKSTADYTLTSIRTERDTGRLVFQYDNLSAKDMTKFVYVCAYANVSGQDVYSNPVKFSIIQYAYNALNSDSSTEDLKSLINGMLEYGALAQNYFSHNTDFLATDEVAKIKVVNGTHSDGFKTGYYKAGTSVTLTANEAEDGYAFSHWINNSEAVIGDSEELTIENCSTNTYSAVYKKLSSIIASGKCGDNLTWTLYEDGNLAITGSGEMYDYSTMTTSSYTKSPWYSYRELIKNVIVDEQVTTIGNYAFWNCSNLQNATIGESVSKINENAFTECTTLKSINLPTSLVAISNNAFRNCYNLTDIIIPNSVTYIGMYAFYNCRSLTEICIPNSLENIISYTFSGCINLTKISIPQSITKIYAEAFYNCYNLSSFNIDNIESWCNIYFLNYTSNPLFYAENLYVNDVLVTDLIIPESVTSISDYAFQNCKSITAVTISKNVTYIGNHAFYGCENLSKVTFKKVSGWSYYLDKYSTTSEGLLNIYNDSQTVSYLTYTYSNYVWRHD